jgi:glycosyltransferase involved in cell wall biosynthesis
MQSFTRASNLQGNLHLLMVGDGELRENCEDKARKVGLSVTFTGFLNQSEIVAAYVAADCLVLCSDAGETWGLVVNEAMACGRPALVSSLAGCSRDLIKPGISGDIFSFGDWEELASKMAALAGDSEALALMGENARLQVEDYSPEAAAQGMCDAVQNALECRMAGRL